MDVINPVTGELEETYETETAADIDDALDDATETFDRWQTRPLRERERLLAAAGEELRANDRSYAETITREGTV
jgi:succinate-semialdehyde dehydrogenase/glutarate-semialdehyde dehydrogenase